MLNTWFEDVQIRRKGTEHGPMENVPQVGEMTQNELTARWFGERKHG